MNNKGKASGFGIYAVAVVIIAVLYLLMSRFGSQTSDYTYDAFVKDVDSGSVTSVGIENSAAWGIGSKLAFYNVDLLGGAVAAGVVGAGFFGCVFSGTYSQFPASNQVTLVGCVKTTQQPALPANINNNISLPYIA